MPPRANKCPRNKGFSALNPTGKCGSSASHEPEQDQCNGGRRGLNPQNPAADGGRAIDAGDDHAQQKEGLDLEGEGGNALNQVPDQAGGEKAVKDPRLAASTADSFAFSSELRKVFKPSGLVQRNISR